ncbi:MAG: gliding motility-associated C-terminal domain-containing protein, partial [Chitinophagaceae bacterium]|nr:gliding motility-associated C-terminal domain-containing protein [Chitinophagaceae bacterium]
VQLTATGGVSYVWTPSTGLSCTNCAAPFASPTATTLYKVTGTDANGCKNTDSVTVTVNPLPNVSAGSNQSICLKDSAQLAATGAVSYTWSPTTGLSCANCANPKASPPSTTVYTVTGTDANGCINMSTITVTILPLPPVNAGSDKTICIGDSVQLQVTGAVSYTWTPLAGLSCTNCANPKASPAITTRYVVTGTGANSCVANDTVFVNVNTLPVVSTGNDTAICRGDTLRIVATGAATYVWTPVKWLSCSTCANPLAMPDSTVTYLVTGTDVNGCIDTADINITVKPVPVIKVTSARSFVCDGDTTQLQATGGNTYAWVATNALSCNNCPNPVASPKINTTFVVRGFVNGCSDTASVFINVRPRPYVKAGPDIAFCQGRSDTLKVNGTLTYVWSPSAGLSCTNCQYPLASPQVTTSYVVTGTDTNGCSNTDTTLVTVYSLPPVNAGPDVTICAGASTKLLAKGATSYTWSPAQGLSCTNCPDPLATVDNTTTYTVSGKDGNGCSNTDDVIVSAILRQDVTYGDNDSICIGQQVELTASGGTDYTWAPADDLSNSKGASVTASPSASTVYRVIIKQGDCFTDTGFITIGVFNPPTVNAGPDQTVSGGTEVHVSALGKGIAAYEWSPADDIDCYTCANAIIRPKRTTTYTVKAISEYGCEATDDITIHVTCGGEQIFVANTFTPNNDGVNDMFFPQGRGLAQVERFSIYSRWGELIFDRKNMPVNDPAAGWNGTFKSEPLKPDVFVYIIRAICENGEPIEIKGDISLVR